MKTSLLALTAALLVGVAPVRAEDGPHVVASIKPIHSLVAAVMQGVGTPDLVIEGAGSPHGYALKPSNASALEAADVIFWMGPDLETFLIRPLESLASGARSVPLEDTPGLTKLPAREGGAFEPHEHHHEGEADEDEHEEHHDADHDDHDEDHDHHEADVHLWLDPANAKVMVERIAETLATVDPAHATTYEANAQGEVKELDALIAETETKLAPVADKPFIVFHDAYHSFENRFGVEAVGSITVNPETEPGAKRISEIRAKVEDLGAVCVFAEPQFEPAIVTTITDGTSAHSGVLDPLGADLEPGPDLYAELIRNLATSLSDCLGSEQ
ncbi:zinc ABC transporter substrate-binding protein [Consotaella aegiceratis]|uniref:zinc ABC transporter substrate-binding protein n=1 Tax=Consotaella aegiceratis TaxID=3097961 RepID=UPI002F3EC807